MKITPEDMNAVRQAIDTFEDPFQDGPAHGQRDMALLEIMISIYDRGYEAGYTACIDASIEGLDD